MADSRCGGGAGNAVVMTGSFSRSFPRLGWFINAAKSDRYLRGGHRLPWRVCEWDGLRLFVVVQRAGRKVGFESRIGPEKIDQLNGLLILLNQHAVALGRETQVRGKPTDHASERWILAMADIFENAFSRAPTVSGSGEDPAGRRGRFYQMMELGRPSRFARHGRLSLKHVQTLLSSRKPPNSPVDFMGPLAKTAGDAIAKPIGTGE
jgi:hypothetical protein